MARSNCVSDLSFSDLEGLRSQTKETDEIASIEKCGDGASPRVITLFLQFPFFDFCLYRDVLSLGITSLEHQKLILAAIQSLRAQVIQMHGRGVQV